MNTSDSLYIYTVSAHDSFYDFEHHNFVVVAHSWEEVYSLIQKYDAPIYSWVFYGDELLGVYTGEDQTPRVLFHQYPD